MDKQLYAVLATHWELKDAEARHLRWTGESASERDAALEMLQEEWPGVTFTAFEGS